MGQDPSEQLSRLRKRIENSDEIADEDREAVLAFDDRLTLLNSEYSDYRHLKLLRHVTIVAEQVGGVATALDDREAAEEIVRWIHRTYDNEENNQDYRVALKGFGRRVSDENGEEPPDSLDWIPSGTSKNYDPAPDPAKMLDWRDDVLDEEEFGSASELLAEGLASSLGSEVRSVREIPGLPGLERHLEAIVAKEEFVFSGVGEIVEAAVARRVASE